MVPAEGYVIDQLHYTELLTTHYWPSTELASGPEIAAILSEVLGRKITCKVLGPDEFKKVFTSMDLQVESWYAERGVESMRQIVAGRMGYIGSVCDDVPHVTGRPALSLQQWTAEYRECLTAAY